MGCFVVRPDHGTYFLWDPERHRPSSTFHATPLGSTFQVHSSDGTGGVMYQRAWLYGRKWENPSRRIYPVRRCIVAASLLRSRRVLAVGRFVNERYARVSWLFTTAAREMLLGFVASVARWADIPWMFFSMQALSCARIFV